MSFHIHHSINVKIEDPNSLQSAPYLLPDRCLDVGEDVGREVRGEAGVGALQRPDQGADPGYNIAVSFVRGTVNLEFRGAGYYDGSMYWTKYFYS